MRGERQCRLLPSRLVVYFVLALCLSARESYEEILQLLTGGLPGSTALVRANRSSLFRARARLGPEVLETLFRQVAGPLATPQTPGAWWLRLRLLARWTARRSTFPTRSATARPSTARPPCSTHRWDSRR
ncbi:transposase domain-containing protein [Actinomadura sp. 9N215]|uniref:transposase domain-containing protein n=1 Tax=Actinomadura sp. 9N215 TaxID=3375150 RepID=UPI00378CF5AD